MAGKRQTDRADPPRRGRGFEAASKLVAGQIRGPIERRGFSEAKLLTHWAEIVGADLAAMARPVRISHGRGTSLGGTLVVLTTGALAPVLEMQTPRLIERVNACYGYRAVARIRITQTAPSGFAEGQTGFAAKPGAPRRQPTPDPARLREAQESIDRVADDGLKQALDRLARNVLSNSKP